MSGALTNTFCCRKCRRRYRGIRNMPRYQIGSWCVTGEVRPLPPSAVTDKATHQYGYFCRTCGYMGWSSNSEVKRAFMRAVDAGEARMPERAPRYPAPPPKKPRRVLLDPDESYHDYEGD